MALAWATLASDKEMLKIAEETVMSAEESAKIAKRRFEAGVTSQLDLYQAQTILYQAKSDVANYNAVVAQDINVLELLAGGKIASELLPQNLEGANEWFGDVSVGLSSEVLLKRPDVAAVEYTLKSANADVGAARAAFFPTISLVAATGLASSELSKLFSDGSSVWSYTGNVNVPIFAGGSNVANLKYAKAKYKSYAAQYDKSVQTAFKEVKDALARRATIYQQIEAQEQLMLASKAGYNLARMRYDKGIETYLNVLEQQRTFYNAEKSLISTRLTEINNRITLYRALGGESEKELETISK
jgi:multidrug efflux system outer membrane protein